MIKVIVVVAALLALAPLARAQDGEDFSGNRPARPSAPVRAGIAGRGSGEVTIAVRSFGVGGLSRPGEWAGVWLEVKDESDKPRNVLVRLANPDIDGDSALMQRVIVTNPGSAQLVWLYLHLPFAAQDTLEIAAFEGIESGKPGPDQQQQYTSGRLLGTYRYQVSPRLTAPIGLGLIGVIGGKTAGLEQYKWVADPRGEHAITGHELTELVGGLSIASLPDRWFGYSAMDALVWTTANTEDSPLNLREQQAEAIREYVKRGGHFVVVLPQVGQNWVAQPNNPLADIMPAVKVTRREGASADEFRSLLTRDKEAELPTGIVVHSFTPAAADGAWASPDAVPVMTGPNQECVVARRFVGTGMVTVIGIDVTSEKLHLRTRAFMAEQFWNRVLGKRLRTPTQLELTIAAKDGRLPNGTKPDAYDQKGQPQRIDMGVVAQSVNNEGSAATGLLLACVVFVAYWLVAGPLGYFILKQKNWRQHAWVAFVCATGVFTAVAWGGANLLKPRRVHGRHLTILQGVYGQPNQQARSWMGLFLPRYGEQELSVAAPTGLGSGDWRNLIATWDSAASGAGASYASFPDARGYVMDVRTPDTAAFPSRATTKQVQVEWAGVLPANWTMPHPVIGNGSTVPVGREIRITERPNPQPTDLKWMIEGTLVHGLPVPLKNVTVLVVREPVNTGLNAQPDGLRRRMSRQQLAEWKPGDPLVLDALFNKNGSEDTAVRDMFSTIAPNTQMNMGLAERDYQDSLVGLATTFMDYAAPPIPNAERRNVVLQRTSTHGLDLSKWLTQSCVIVVGEIGSDRAGDEAECPIPIRVDDLAGDQVRSRVIGRTIVRWVYPLEATPFETYNPPPAGGPAPIPPGTTPDPAATPAPTSSEGNTQP